MSLIERTLALAHPAPHRVIPPPVNSSKHNPVPDTPRSPDGYPLRRRLLLLHLASGALIALVLCAVFLAARKSDARQAAAHRLSALADFACAQWNQVDVPTSLPPPAITPAILDSVLAGFSTLPDVQEAALVDADGTVLAGYRRYPFPVATSPRPSQPGVFFDEDSLLFVRSCSVGARSHVLLHLRATVAPPPSPALAILALTGLAAGVSLLSFLALGRIALRPLHRLADDVRRAAGDPADAARVYSSTDHATAPLVDGFNELLWRIRRNGADLQAARLRAEREQSGLRFILEALPVGVTSSILDADGGLTQYVNGAQTRITGLSREQCGRPAAHARLTHPDDAARETVLRERLLSGEIDRFSLEKRLVRPDGSTIWVISTFLRRDYADGTLEELATFVDISELRRAREQAEREQARLRFILESMPIGITSAILDVEDRLTQYVNSAQERITGLSREQYNQPAAYARLTHPDDAAREAVLRERLRSGEIDRFSLEKRLIRPDGSTVWVISTYLRRDYADGTLEELATFVDVSELRRAREQAEREQARLRFILESMPIGITSVILDDEGRLTRYVNGAQERITGLSREQYNQPAAYARLTHPDDAAREEGLQERLRSGEIDRFSLEKRLLRPDGVTVWVISTYLRRDYADGTLEELATFVDVSELRRAREQAEREQARFRFIFETIPVGLDWMTLDDPAGRIVNPAHTRITGVPASLASEPARELEATHAEDRKRELALEARLLSGEIDHYTLEKRYLGPDGAVTWAELNLRRHADPVTGAIQRIGTLVDLTEHKRAQAEIERMHRQLIDTSRQAGMAEVATGVLHNVGNVLNSVNVSFTIVSDQLRLSKAPNLAKVCALLEPHESDLPAFFAHDPKGRMILPYLQALSASLSEERKTVGAEVDSLRRNIEHIKDIVAMQQAYAKTSGVSETISMPDLVEDALRMNADSFSSHDIEIVRDFQIRPVVSLDKNKALQILVNLLRNAQNACDESGRTEKRIVIRILGDENFVRIRITDNGVGIPPENLTRIFAHGFTTRKHGHGFGLHSGALAAREIGGSLQAFSDGPGQGATFELTLPHTPPSDS